MVPWLITTTGWPDLTAHVAGAAAHAVVEPAIVGGATAGALAFTVVLLLLWRRGRARAQPGRRST